MGVDNNKRANDLDSAENEMTQEDDALEFEKISKWTFFKAGWRPALGWLSVIIVFYSFIIHPAIIWWVILNGYVITVPMIDSTALLNLVAIVIGVGAMRTYEKVRFNEDDEYPKNRSLKTTTTRK